jgi:hypothetical protein
MVSAGFVLEKTQVWHPKTRDLYLFSFDASLHVQLAFLVGQAFAVLPWLRAIGVAFYIALPIPMAMVYAGQLLRGREKAFPAMAAFFADRSDWPAVLQPVSRAGARAHFLAGFSLASDDDGASGTPAARTDCGEGRAKRDSFAAHGVGAAGLVVFARAFGLRARHCDDVCGVHCVCNAGHGRALLYRSGRGVSF